MGNTSIKRCVHSSVCPPKTHPSSSSALLCAHKGMISVNSINRLPHPLTFCESQPVGGPHRRWQSRWGKRSGYFFPRDFPFVVHYCGSGCTSPLLQLLLSGPSSIALVSKKDLVIPFSSLVSSDLIIPFSSLVYFLVLLVPGYLNLPGWLLNLAHKTHTKIILPFNFFQIPLPAISFTGTIKQDILCLRETEIVAGNIDI